MVGLVENSVESIKVVPTGTAVGAEVRGLDLSKPVFDQLKEKLIELWGKHMVLLFRNQDLSDENILATAEVFGGQQIAGSRAFFLKAGYFF